jgi:DNA-binding transcriptional regulator GbsR (MarR family)
MEKRMKLFNIDEISEKTGLSKATIRQDIRNMYHYRFGRNDKIMMSEKQIEDLLWARTRLVTPE